MFCVDAGDNSEQLLICPHCAAKVTGADRHEHRPLGPVPAAVVVGDLGSRGRAEDLHRADRQPLGRALALWPWFGPGSAALLIDASFGTRFAPRARGAKRGLGRLREHDRPAYASGDAGAP